MPTKIYLGTVDKSLTSKNDFITHDELRTNFFESRKDAIIYKSPLSLAHIHTS